MLSKSPSTHGTHKNEQRTREKEWAKNQKERKEDSSYFFPFPLLDSVNLKIVIYKF